ncbi:MAG: acyl-ACP--UDP-N-acetylglucosamine O-acyltransferase [Planctomyces sp.]|jgi:UDP-N-acetylglucosamine acyltransferase|nr:acyl-ACP--UDP-N-acetylglucosamine O-acyltransferase [Planctomyces sp.]
MASRISPLAQIDPHAKIGDNVDIGPFCVIGPHVTIGSGCQFDSHVTVTGHTIIGQRNRMFPFVALGGEPQDLGYSGAPTYLDIGDDNTFREGVTVHRGAEKEDYITRIGNNNYLMANSHVGHNCHVHNNIMLANGCLLAGHVHVYDNAFVSGNSVVHQFASIGTHAFLSGGCRAPTDIPPYMISAGSDEPKIVSVNLIGLKRRGLPESTINIIRQAHRLLFRDHKPLDEARHLLLAACDDVIPWELTNLLDFLEQQRQGKQGRAREAVRSRPANPHPLRRAA